MKSKIAEAIKMKYSPVAILWSDEKPEGALEFQEGRRGCVMALVASASKGRAAVARKETVGCAGGAIGLGLSDTFGETPGGIENFLSNGNPEFCKTEAGRMIAEKNPDVLKGEGYIKTPELAKRFTEELPKCMIPQKYVVYKPIEMLGEDEIPVGIIFLVNPDQLSGLVFLANYTKEGTDSVTIPMGAGCHQIGILLYQQAESDDPKAVVGLTDPSARMVTNNALGRDILSFAVPYKMYVEMENEVDNSFLRRHTWAVVMGDAKGNE
ncbi:MAG: DUF169 domain-containing protein [Armatimonadota bacterium]